MLILQRRRQEEVYIVAPDGTRITIMVTRIDGDRVKLGIDAPSDYAIHRREVAERMEADDAT